MAQDYLRQRSPAGMSPITTGARGPNTPFPANQIVFVPGIGAMKLSDYIEKGNPSGIDVPVKSRSTMRSNAVNQVVNVNGIPTQLTGYMPKQYDPQNVDPTGGGNLDAYGHPIKAWSGSPPGGWGGPTNYDVSTTAPWSEPTNPQELDPTATAYEPQPGAAPSELPSPVATEATGQYQEPYQYQPPPMPEPTASGDYGGYPAPTPSELPSPSEIPIYQQQTAYPTEANAPTAGANIPTNDQGIMPTGPNEFLPSAGANVPTDQQFVYPTDPQQYLPSDAGANIPTNEDVTATLAPDAFRPPDDTYSYPAGDGTYTKLDANGQPVAPAQPTFDVNYNPADTGPLYGDQKKPTTFFQDLGADVTDIGNVLGTATPVNTALSGEPGFGAHPSSYTGPGGGAFWTPAGGVPLGPLGQGSHGMIPWEYYARMARARMMKGGDPTLGLGELNTRPGDTIARFQAGGTGYGGTNMMGGYGIRGRGGRVASAYVNPNFYAPPVPEASSQKPGGGAAAGGIGGGGPGGIP